MSNPAGSPANHPMSPVTAPKSGPRRTRPSTGKPLATIGRILLGVLISVFSGALGAACSSAVGYFFFTDASPTTVLASTTAAFILFLAVLPGLGLWRSRTGNQRLVGIGMATGGGLCLGALAITMFATDYDPSAMTSGQIRDALSSEASRHHSVYYLGTEADGQHIASITHLRGGLTFVEYGRCLDNAEGECNRPVTVTSQPTSSFGSRGESPGPCRRLPPVLGVPAADMGELMVFTDSTIVSITYWQTLSNGYMPDPPRERAIARLLRPVTSRSAVTSLALPDQATQHFLDKYCSQR